MRRRGSRKHLWLGIVLLWVAAMVHQYFWAMPEHGLFSSQERSIAELESDGLRPTPYPEQVWFEIVPDAFTTLFKRLGLGGWTEINRVACATGCIEQEIRWTDGFQTIDLALKDFSIDGEALVLSDARWIRLEVWGGVRHAFKQENGSLPSVGQLLGTCGYLRRDDPYDWLEIHPRNKSDLEVKGSCI